MKKRYLFFDIDGTLAAGGYENIYIPDSTRLALKKLKEAGHFIAIATGRMHALAVDFMDEFGIYNMVSDGGYGITIEGKLQEIKPLPKEAIIELIQECKEKDFSWGLQVEDSDTRFVPDDRFMDFTHDKYVKTKVVPGLDPKNYEKIYKAYVACYAPREQELETLKKLPWGRYHKEYFFVEPTYKAEGIKKMMDYLHADYQDVIVFGDSSNDISMFIDEWTKVAMGNAIDELKKIADYVTADVKEDGIYKACEHLGLFL